MAGECIYCGFAGTNDQMADHAGEMCQDNFGYGDFLIMYGCKTCGIEHFFEPHSLPGGNEHCLYCEYCGGDLEVG